MALRRRRYVRYVSHQGGQTRYAHRRLTLSMACRPTARAKTGLGGITRKKMMKRRKRR